VSAFLEDLGVGICNIDQPQVSYALGLTSRVSSAIGYLRLHGRNTATWFQEDAGRDARYDYLYSEEELNEILKAVENIARRARDTYLVTNNHFRGQAAINALELRAKLRREPVAVPPPLLTAHPALRSIARQAGAES
jgi:uncharacterized protein YecE (DUF72 family)